MPGLFVVEFLRNVLQAKRHPARSYFYAALLTPSYNINF
jgi:uncharacterized protein Veg